MESLTPHGLQVKLNNTILIVPKWSSTGRKPLLLGTASALVANKKQKPRP